MAIVPQAMGSEGLPMQHLSVARDRFFTRPFGFLALTEDGRQGIPSAPRLSPLPAATGTATSLPRAMRKRASDKLSEGYRQQLADQGMRQIVVHEMGHCCGLMGHYRKDDPAKREASIGNKTCPMHYSDYTDGLQYIVLQVLMSPGAAMPAGRGQFCKDDDFDCWGHLNVKDN